MPSAVASAWSPGALRDVVARHWGFPQLRPLQEEAMHAVLQRRDSLVVLPTGGGKSLCYQAPALLLGGTTVVVSPLIALMKDQVDGLRGNGVAAAAQLDSSLSGSEKSKVEAALRAGAIRLLFVSPERLVGTDLYKLLQKLGVRTFAIDEAHCISHWGHDFRPEYRQLSRLREVFPEASVHAYTATATEQVRQDIIRQLALNDPAVLVGDFDRPNLAYRVLPRHDRMRQIEEVLERHQGEAGIIYCSTRNDVGELTEALQRRGVNAQSYHAGLSPEQRQATQEAFANEQCDIVVATVAFGMGVDRSNVRFVLHAAMPKSLEHYQQEAGRAGRDGLEAECVLLYSGADTASWRSRIQNPRDAEEPPDPEFVAASLKHLEDMDRYARGAVCRHRALVEYFGQGYARPSCNACDLCLGDTEEVADALVVAQKILSCVARVQQGFGINHVLAVLRGDASDNVRRRGHDRLTTFGLLREHSVADLRDWVYQLIGQGVLVQTEGDYPLLRLNDGSWQVMRGKREVRLIRLKRLKKSERAERAKAAEEVSWEGIDRGLFETLRKVRYDLATQEKRKPYQVFSDAVLRDLARVRPSSPERMRLISGVGDVKLNSYGDHFLPAIAAYCREHDLALDVSAPVRPAPPREVRAPGPRLSARHAAAFGLFRQGAAVEDVMNQMDLARSTVQDYLEQFIKTERPATIDAWVDDGVYQRVAQAARQVGTQMLKPIFLALGETVEYDTIRLVRAHLQARAEG
jgi:ATP-dependent DNA helicase RecQ